MANAEGDSRGKEFPLTKGEVIATMLAIPLAGLGTSVANSIVSDLSVGKNKDLIYDFTASGNLDMAAEARIDLHQDEAMQSLTQGFGVDFNKHPVVSTLSALTAITLFIERLGVKTYENDSLLITELKSTKAFALRYVLQHQALLIFASYINSNIANGEFNIPSGLESTLMVLGCISTIKSIISSYDFVSKLVRKSKRAKTGVSGETAKLELNKVRKNGLDAKGKPLTEINTDQDPQVLGMDAHQSWKTLRAKEEEKELKKQSRQVDQIYNAQKARGEKFPLAVRKPFTYRWSFFKAPKVKSDAPFSELPKAEQSLPLSILATLLRVKKKKLTELKHPRILKK